MASMALILVLPALGCDSGDGSSTDDSATSPTTEASTEVETSETGDGTDSETGSDSETSGDPSESESETTDTTEGTTAGGDGFASSIYPDIIAANCSCHVGGGSGGLPMPDAATAYTNLVDTPSSQLNTMSRVTPGDSQESYLFHKISDTHTDVGGSGGLMPQGGPMLDQGSIDAVQSWIDSGAAE